MTAGFSHSVLPTVPIYEKHFEQNLVLGILHILAAIIHFQVYLKHIYRIPLRVNPWAYMWVLSKFRLPANASK